MYEYVALATKALDCGDSPEAVATCQATYEAYLGGGWEECLRASWPSGQLGGVHILRRPKDEPMVDTVKARVEPCCEGRLWTEKEISGLISAWEAGQAGTPHRRWSEEELEKLLEGHLGRVEELLQSAINKHLYPLETIKEETRGKDVKKGYNPPPADLRLPRKPPPPPPTKEDSNG